MITEITEQGGEFFYNETIAQVFEQMEMRPKVMV